MHANMSESISWFMRNRVDARKSPMITAQKESRGKLVSMLVMLLEGMMS